MKKVFIERGSRSRKELVKAMEIFVVDSAFEAAKVFLWWVLCMIFASLRFDDAIHVKPLELEVTQDGIFGISWQWKTERRLRGTKFLVPDVGFSHAPWLSAGIDGFRKLFPGKDADRDF